MVSARAGGTWPSRRDPPDPHLAGTVAAARGHRGAPHPQGDVVGFHGRRSGTLVEPAGCLVVRPEILDAMPVLARITALGASRSATLRLTVTTVPPGLDVEVGGGRPLDAALRADLAAIAGPASRGSPGTASRWRWRGRHSSFSGNARVVPPPGAFLQATAEGEAALVAAVAEAVGPARRRRRPLRRLRHLHAAARRRGRGAGRRGRGRDGGGACGRLAPDAGTEEVVTTERATCSAARCCRAS